MKKSFSFAILAVLVSIRLVTLARTYDAFYPGQEWRDSWKLSDFE